MVSKGFETLINVSPTWKDRLPEDHLIRFEDLLKHPYEELYKLLQNIGIKSQETFDNIEHSINNNPLKVLASASNHHGWVGKSENWIKYINKNDASVALANNDIAFRSSNYSITNAQDITDEEIETNWQTNRKK